MQFTRRQFAILSGMTGFAAMVPPVFAEGKSGPKWYERVKRWSQINFTGDDARGIDLAFWREYWKSSRTQGVILSAGGQVAFYPTKMADHARAPMLGDGDVFGDVVRAARDEGLEVVARLSLRGSPEIMVRHPDWANVDVNGKVLRTPCMNGGYHYEYGAQIVREVAQLYRPAGFTLSGWGPNYSLCYCQTCSSLFRKATGQDLPRARNWDDPTYRRWVDWNNDQVIALWDHGNSVAREAGGADCLWMGQLVGSMMTRNLRRIAERTPFMMIDHQSPEDESGLVDNAVFAKTLNGIGDWKKPVTVASSLYAPRLNSPQNAEFTLWMTEGMAGGSRPWWNMIGGYSEDKRRFAILPPLLQWHERAEPYLFDRRPMANIGIVWSEANNVFHGREAYLDRVHSPWQGLVNALTHQRIPFVVVNADHIDRDAEGLAGIVLPDLAAMTDGQMAAVRRFAMRGGGVLATGDTSLCDQYGTPRADYGLADLFGAHRTGEPAPTVAVVPDDQIKRFQAGQMLNSGAYVPADLIRTTRTPQSSLRLFPELRRNAYGPHRADEPAIAVGAVRHPALAGFDDTDLMFFGDVAAPLRIDADASVLLSYVPPVDNTSPETAVFEATHTEIPGLIVRDMPSGGRVAFLPADLCRQYERHNQPDHARLLGNLVRWISRDAIPLAVESGGTFDFNLFRQPARVIVHIGNLTNSAAWRKPVDQLVPAGPLDLRIKLPADVAGGTANLLVAGGTVQVSVADGWASLRLPSVLAHEVVVIS